MTGKTKLSKRVMSIVLCLALLMTYVPVWASAAGAAITTVADPETLTRPETIYGDNTMNAGKVTVGKSVSNTSITVNGKTIPLTGDNNFLITISQSAQVMGLTSQTSVPVDVVFVLDTSGSMEDNGRAETMVTAANSAIATLMAANEQNRVAVVAFSSEGDGGGSSNGNAANVLSSLAHYTGDAATNHLRWVTDEGDTAENNGNYIAGRDTVTVRINGRNRTVSAFRHGLNGGTNIQAGIIEGAKILTSVTNTTYTDPKTNESVIRIPFLIILSDGQPTYTYSDETWYAPTSTSEQGPGSGSYEGNGFIAAMTAAYYKGLITEHYYGEKANAENRCFVYTMGVEISSLTGDNLALAQITLDPKSQTTGDSAADGANSYWHYGNTFNDDTKNIYYGWKTYWENYLADPAADFDVRINSGGSDTYIWVGEGEPQEYYEVQRPREPSRWASDEDWEQYEKDLVAYNAWLEWRDANFLLVTGRTYTFTAESIAASRKYVSSIAYNDEYFSADSVSQMQAIFEAMVRTIQEKAISSPTKVTTGDHNFDGYINFYDPIGEYMEVKDMKGVLANGQFYEGSAFAQKLMNYGTANADADFDAMLRQVIKTRMGLSSADGRFETEEALDAFIDSLLSSARDSKNQAYYTDSNNFDNSIVWWGNAYDSGEEDKHVQMIGFADDDSIAYITDAATQIPEGADYVCRSYFFYGTGETAREYMYFMVRIQRELVAPYRETVVISAPASLLSVEKVLINETYDDDGNLTYTATVEHKEPARVVYEVGLWDTITPENVSLLVSADYASEKVNGAGSVNYDPATDTYHFFTNDWDRTESLDSHHRGMAKATFDAAADNPFYTYQKDTLVVDANGNPVTADPAGTTAYYVREYYEWADDGKNDGTYTATKKTVLIEVEIPENTELLNVDGQWFIPAGTYTAATLVVNGDDTMKDDPTTETANDGNKTGTSSIVAHPHRTGSADNSHYTVFLGNNGKLSMVADPYEPGKTVSVNLPDGAVSIVDDEGKPVEVGDVLTYTIEVKNVLTEAADITVTDYIPLGTAFVEGSAGSGTKETGHTKDASIKPDSNNVLTWALTDVPAGETRYVSFQVTVTEAALSLNVVPGSLSNTAVVQINDLPTIHTNTTHSSVFGKSVTDVNNQDIDGDHGFKVGDTLVYHIRFHNNATDSNGNFVAANVTVTDKLPAGTTFLSADNGGSYDAATGTVTWSFENMAANTSKVVSFRVQINAGAKISESGTQPETGEIYLPNTATITVNNDPVITNTTQNWADVGDMVISKTVAAGGDQSKTFTILLGETSGLLDGTYVMLRGAAAETVVFTNGRASVTIKHGETVTIKGLPAGTIISVAEDVSALPGWTPTYNTQSITIVKGAATTVSSVSVTNTYTLQPLTLTLKGEKNVTGILPNETTFGFVAVPDSSNPVVGDPLTGEVTVKASGKYEFALSPKTFTQPGVYRYTISEINGGVEGITYDDTDHVLVINVIDNGDGTMRAEATLNNEAFDMSSDAVSFTNAYAPAEVPLVLDAQKTLMVYDAANDTYVGAAPAAGQFHFQIVDKATGKVFATGTNDATGKITFSTIYFSADMLGDAKSKTFTFLVSEVVSEDDRDPNMAYDQRKLEFQAVLTYTDEGKLTITVNGDSDGVVSLASAVNFINYANPDSVEVRPQGSKTTTPVGRVPEGASFSFAVINTATGNKAAAGVGAANGSITFSALSFSTTGTYTYWIKESNSGNTTNGITYDTTRYLMKVVVSRNEFGRLVAEVTYWTSAVAGSTNVADYTVAAQIPAFHNEYNAGGYINLTARKVLEGRDLVAGEFAFKLIRQDNGGEIDGIVDATGKITFSTLYYSEADIPAGESSAVIHYVMSEVIPASAKLPGVTYDDAQFDVYIRITDDGNGNIIAELVKPDGNGGYTAVSGTDTGAVFTNKYAPVHGDEIKFQIQKDLNGRPLQAGEFEFHLFLGENPGPDAVPVAVATNDANGIVTFIRQISANVIPGTYAYTIKEAAGSAAGVTYDGASYTIYVKVTDDGKGSIVAQLVDSNGTPLKVGSDGIVDLTDEIVFTNTYVPGDATVQLEANKVLTGRAQKDKEFSFVVRKDNVNGQIVAVGSNDVNGKILFSTLDITAADMAGAASKTFTYVVMESNNNIPGVSVDPTVFTVTVTVTDDGSGALKAVVNYPDGNPIVFKNTYAPGAAKLPLVAFKSLSGKNLQANEFTFELKDAAGNVVQTVHNDANGVISMNDLIFTAEDMVDDDGNKVMSKTFVYTLTEKTGDVDGMVYDTNVYTITVTVTDDGNGNLVATAAYTDTNGKAELIQFVNSYTPSSVEAELEGTKTIVDANGNPLTGENYDLAGFEFQVFDVEGNLITTAISDSQGNIKFTGFEFTQAGEYRFLISEKTTTRPGYTTDPTVWCVHITIGYNANTGMLYEAGEYIHLAPENHEGIMAQASETLNFVNIYDPANVSLTLKVKKELEGRELRDHEFTFYMVDDATGLRVAEARNHANGDINLHLTYTTAGIYSYTIFEFTPAESDKLGGVEYSTEAYKLTVTVTDDGTGALKAEVGTVTVLGEGTVDMTGTTIFHNKYEADPVDVIVEATKTLAGKALWDREFTFELINVADSTEKYTATNTADGKIVFDQITFTEAGVYVYELSEVEGSADYVTYDGHKYTVTITVTDDGNGKLHAVTQYTSSSGTEADPVFHNVYTPTSVDYFPEVTKIFEGGEMRTFTFVLSGEGFETQTKQNDADGKVLFDKLTFTKAGTYTFTITEQADPDMEDVKWDTNVYTLVITVSDEGYGELKIDGETVTSEHGRDDLVFHNVLEDLVTDKDVILADDPDVSIDGMDVEVGDVLTYIISYTNYTGKTADVTIIDTIPAHTTYVEGSADNEGIFEDGVLTWNLTGIAPYATVTVSFDVTVSADNVIIENQATVLEGENTYTTNTVSSPVPIPEPPYTGDSTRLRLLVALLTVSGCGLISLTACGKRKETDEEN